LIKCVDFFGQKVEAHIGKAERHKHRGSGEPAV
jgi:hypothetical protein